MASWEPVSALSYFAQPIGLKVLFALLLVLTQAFIIVVAIRICRQFFSRIYFGQGDLEEAETNEGSQEFLDEAGIAWYIRMVHNPRHHGVQTLL